MCNYMHHEIRNLNLNSTFIRIFRMSDCHVQNIRIFSKKMKEYRKILTAGYLSVYLCCSWCPGITGTIDHIFFDCPSAIAFWNRLAKILDEILGPRPLQKTVILYGHSILYTTPQQLTNYLLVLAKTTIYTICLATNSTHSHTLDNQCMFLMRLQYRLDAEMHYSLWANNVDTFRGYRFHFISSPYTGKFLRDYSSPLNVSSVGLFLLCIRFGNVLNSN
jgi:hypothetical protein